MGVLKRTAEKLATNAFFAVENWGTNNNGNPNYA